jgi:site-specific DNA-methyltransferase (adenine-specific)
MGIMISEVYNIDCNLFMKDLPDGFFDLAIVDPPYGIGAGSTNFINGTSKSEKPYYRDIDWDTQIPDEAYFLLLKYKSKNQIIWGGNYFVDYLGNFRCFVIWDKTIHGNSYADCELAWTSFDEPARYYRENIAQTNSDGRIHPTQKSIKLYKWLLKNYAKPGDKIFDSHMGSQSSRIAALDMGFDYWGCELDKDYFRDGCKRFENFKAQLKIFP